MNDEGTIMEKERKAELMGKISLIMSIMCIVLGLVCATLTEKPFEIGERAEEILLWLPIGLEIVTILICIIGLFIKQTILLKRVLWGHILYWVSRFLGILLIYGLVELIFGWFEVSA